MAIARDLKKVAAQLEKAEAQAAVLRTRRNTLLLKAMTEEELTEREAAELAHVSPTYAHRVKKHEGRPPSGPALTKSAA
jgi:hypothetical protein